MKTLINACGDIMKRARILILISLIIALMMVLPLASVGGATVIEQQTDDDTASESDGGSTASTVICCVVLLLIIIVPLVIVIIFAIINSKKVNARTESIAKQWAASGPPPAAPQQGGPLTWAQQIFVGNSFRMDMKLLSLGYNYQVYDAWNRPIAFCHMKPFKLKEDIRVYTDKNKHYEIMSIQQEQILDFSGTFQIWDSQSRQFIGILKRKALKSIIKDEWSIQNYNRQEIGHIKEDSTGMALIRRYMKFGGWIPNAQFITYQGRDMGVVKEKFRIIGNEYFVHLVPGTENILDRRLAIAVCFMMARFETRKGR
jgi:hypothetical protein